MKFLLQVIVTLDLHGDTLRVLKPCFQYDKVKTIHQYLKQSLCLEQALLKTGVMEPLYCRAVSASLSIVS